MDLTPVLDEVRTVAVVGASPDPSRPSNEVAAYLLAQTGWDVRLVNPRYDEVLGQPCHPSLSALDLVPDLVDVFRRSEHLPGIARDAIAVGARVLWTQLGIRHPAAETTARDAGLVVVAGRCLKVEHARHARGQ